MNKQYRIFDWYLRDATNYKKTVFNDVSCGTISVNETSENNTDSYFYNTVNIYPNEVGNTLSSSLCVSTDTPVEMAINDGTYKFSISISSQHVLVGGDTIDIEQGVFHDFWMCLKGTSARLYIDNVLVWSGEVSDETTDYRHTVGYNNYTTGTSQVYIRLLRCTMGDKHPIDFTNLVFEVQVDTSDSFDSVNLRTYYNDGDKVLCREDSTIESVAYGTKRARAFRIPLIPRQPDMPYFFFFRVRVLGKDVASDWAYYEYGQPDNPFIFDTKVLLGSINGVKENLVVFCEENKSSYIFVKGSLDTYDGDSFIQCKLSDGYWKKVINSYFMLDPDLTDTVWTHMYDDRLSGGNVYSRYNKSGNISMILESDAVMVDRIHTKLLQAIRNSRIQSASDSVLETNFGKRYGITKDNFENILEYRYALLSIQNAYCFPGEYSHIIDIFNTITGVKPHIYEYKNMSGWVIWDDADLQTASKDEIFILKDEDTIYPDYNEAVLYSDAELGFGFDIHIYNPFDIKLTENLVKNIVFNFKPVASCANIILYDKDGREYQYPGYYYFSNYGKDLYYPMTLGE